MKILLVLQNYLPTKNGGIENYSHWLAGLLNNAGHKVEVAYLNVGEADHYEFENIPVTKLADQKITSFKKLLEEKKYDICHFHEYSGVNGINIEWFSIAKGFCKVFFTFHLPYLTCYKNDFRYLGIEDCNDFSSTVRCAKCVTAEYLKYQEGRKYSIYNFGVDVATSVIEKTRQAAKLKQRIEAGHADLESLINICDNIFIYANWFKEILKKNGFDFPSIKKIPYITKTVIPKSKNDFSVKRKVLFVGRIEQQKGLHLLCKAMNIITTNIHLDVFGNIVDKNYFDECNATYKFNFKGTLNRIELLKLLSEYDFLILPSVFPEMYSMMIKDSFYEKLPVIASNSKGNRDAVSTEENGFLFRYGDYKDLASVIDHAYDMKMNGWEPDFGQPGNQQHDLQEILSYYN